MQEVGRFLARRNRLLGGPDDATVILLLAGEARLEIGAGGTVDQGRHRFCLVDELFVLQHEKRLGARKLQAGEDLVDGHTEFLEGVHRPGNRATPLPGLPAENRGSQRTVKPRNSQGLPAAPRRPPSRSPRRRRGVAAQAIGR